MFEVIEGFIPLPLEAFRSVQRDPGEGENSSVVRVRTELYLTLTVYFV
jgi:hypothetical protein